MEMLSTVFVTEKKNANVAIPTEVFGAFADWCERTDKLQRRALARILRGFLARPELVQKVWLRDVTAGMEGEYAAALEKLAAEVRAGAGHLGADDGDEEMDELGELPIVPLPNPAPAPAPTAKKPDKGTDGRNGAKGRRGRHPGHRP